jgi:hypothetical protein
VISVELEQRDMIKILHVKGLKLDESATELSSTDGQAASAPPSIKYRLHQIKLGRTDLQTHHVGGRPPLEDNDAELIFVLRKFLFSSVRTIAESWNIHASTISDHLVEKTNFTFFDFVGFPTY